MTIYKKIGMAALISSAALSAVAQRKSQRTDTINLQILDSVTIRTVLKNSAPSYLKDTYGTEIFAGKKTQVLQPDASDANLAQNIARMTFAKIPGLVIWDMDGAGTQSNIGARSTDAHRSIEMNMRQNGYNTNSDMFGYPEDHYTVPMQGIQDIQYVRGSAALQFGSQFGGMMNYVMKHGDSTKPFAVESEQTAGANNFFNSYNAVGGTSGKLNYYAYYDTRQGDGWRPNAAFNYHAYYVDLNYKLSGKGALGIQFSRMDYVQQIAGGLTDAQFNADPKQQVRKRNFFNPEINTPAITFKYKFSPSTQLQVQSNAIFGQRNSVQFINTPNIKDTINPTTNAYNPRQVDRDYYSGFTTEARLLTQYHLGNWLSSLAVGARFSSQDTRRKQKGVGTTASDFDLSLVKPYGIDLKLHTTNYAVFAENVFQLTNNFSVTPGIRHEVIRSSLDGVINNATVPVVYKGNRHFPLAGLGLQYTAGSTQLYGNFTQAYRPYLYAAVTPATQVDKVDPHLKDSKGYDIDFGWRGHYSDIVRFDISLYYLYYGDRVGLLTQTDDNNVTYLYSTNIGNSVAKGVEAYVEFSLPGIFNPGHNRATDLRIFNSLAYNHARYTSGTLNRSGVNVSIRDNYVENTPEWVNKTGIRWQHKSFSTSVQCTYSSRSYSDALNTVSNATGVVGLIPSWQVWDWVADYRFNIFHLSAGVNNIANKMYFNRRINMYPGPGILPADGRTFYVSFGIKI